MPCGYTPLEWDSLDRHERRNAIIAELACDNFDLREKVARLKDDARKRQHWIEEAKEAAGFHHNVSFDDVWGAALKVYLASKKTNPVA